MKGFKDWDLYFELITILNVCTNNYKSSKTEGKTINLRLAFG